MRKGPCLKPSQEKGVGWGRENEIIGSAGEGKGSPECFTLTLTQVIQNDTFIKP